MKNSKIEIDIVSNIGILFMVLLQIIITIITTTIIIITFHNTLPLSMIVYGVEHLIPTKYLVKYAHNIASENQV